MLSNHRRTGLAACALLIGMAALGACGADNAKPTRVLDETIERSASPSPTTSSTAPTTSAPTTTVTTLTTALPITEAPTTAAPQPSDAPPLPQPVIEVDYQVPDGSTGSAAIDGPSGHVDRALDSGIVVFDALPDGTYEVVVTVTTPTPPTDATGATIGPASSSARGRVEVHPGDHAVISCSGYADCQGLL